MDYTIFTEKPIYLVGLIILMIWSLIWKGLALWKAARNNDNVWFILMMVLNTSGILEIIYYYFISKRQK